MKLIKCPECNSERVTASGYSTVSAVIDVNSLEIIEIVRSEYCGNQSELENFRCQTCKHEWENEE
jgi:hypothetical protein